MKKSSIFTLFLFLSFLNSLSAKSVEGPLAPALYVFGDSLTDSGNNNGLPTQAKANYTPYGIDFVGGVTGRFTNGNTFTDIIARLLGLPFAPPYLGLSEAERSKIITGLNYASGSAGILPETGSSLGKNIPLGKQIKYFKRTVKKDLPQNFKGQQDLFKHLCESIFIVSIGGNDYLNNYLQPDYYNSSKHFSPERFAGFLVHKLSHHLKTLYKLGARKIVVFDIGPIGCSPSITNAVDFNKACVEEVNQLVLEYNRLLPLLAKKLKLLPGSNFVQGLTFASGYEVYQNPSKYGFKYTNIPCCVVSNHGTTACLPDQPPCQDRDQYLFWDAFHPTQAANALIAVGCFNQSTTMCTPMNIQQLVQVKEANTASNKILVV